MAPGKISNRSKPSDIDRYIGARIRMYRLIQGARLADVARRAGVLPQQMYKYEQGICTITAARLYAIAEALHCEVADFFEGVDDPACGKDDPLKGFPPPAFFKNFARLHPESQSVVELLVRHVARRSTASKSS